jgi:hypothetical protein
MLQVTGKARGPGFVQQCNHRTPQLPEQMAEKFAHLLVPDIREVEFVVKTQVVSVRADREF